VIPLPRSSAPPAVSAAERQRFCDALLQLCLQYHPAQFDPEALHPSLPSNALLLRCEFSLLERSVAAGEAARESSALAHPSVACAAPSPAAVCLSSYREGTRLLLQLMREEKDLVAVSQAIAKLT
jgi:hypothetical protein